MEEVKEEKILSKKEIRRRKKLGELFEKRRRKGHEKWVRKIRREAAKKKAAEAKRKEKEKEKKRLQRLKEQEKKKAKKRVGRPKKTGPKVNYYKRKKKLNEKLNKIPCKRAIHPIKYKIISCCNGKQNKLVGKYRYIEDAYEVFNNLKDQDTHIVFPKLIMCSEVLQDSLNEYILIQLIEDDVTAEYKLRNEYGKLVNQVTNQDGWAVIDKFKYNKEETFWVYGYEPKKDRKTFTWIYENILLDGLENPYEFKRVILFKNKIVIKDDNGSLELIITKHPSDAIRFYNLLEEWVKKDKLKQIIFAGDYTPLGDRREKLINELIELTGWSKNKITLPVTTKTNNNLKKEI